MKVMNKKGDIAILALVMLSVILLGSTLFVFYTNSAKISSEINDARMLNAIYIKEQQIDFYVNEAVDRSFKKSFDENSFLLEFKNNLRFYDKNDILVREELLKIAEEVNENNIEYGKELVLNIKTEIVVKEKDMIVSYNYDKGFVRKLNL